MKFSPINDIVKLFFPAVCDLCGKDLTDREMAVCPTCIKRLPYTEFELLDGNPVEKVFWGRIPVKAAFASFYFHKSMVMQKLIHRLKYRGDTKTGILMGNLIGKRLQLTERFGTIDYLIPLPLHPKKMAARGYNQAAVIAEGISEIIQTPVLVDVLIRNQYTDTQTRKHRTERWENVSNKFSIIDPNLLANKNVLLVDDVITTGATLEAAGQELLSVPGLSLCIGTVAMATH